LSGESAISVQVMHFAKAAAARSGVGNRPNRSTTPLATTSGRIAAQAVPTDCPRRLAEDVEAGGDSAGLTAEHRARCGDRRRLARRPLDETSCGAARSLPANRAGGAPSRRRRHRGAEPPVGPARGDHRAPPRESRRALPPGRTIPEISELLGVGQTQIWRDVHALGLEARPAHTRPKNERTERQWPSLRQAAPVPLPVRPQQQARPLPPSRNSTPQAAATMKRRAKG
jgi:hypothetical protein